MPTNEERIEVAARLRSVTSEEISMCFIEEVLTGCIGVEKVYDFEYGIDERLLINYLADLIEPEPINGETFDGYHTFNELYHHRALLFSVVVRNYPELCWKSKKHHAGDMYEGMFIVGINTPDGQASYHYDIDPYWDMFECDELEFAPEWDGHTPSQAIERIGKLMRHEQEQERTCFAVIPNEIEGYVFCPKCGAEIGEYGVPNFCHNCGKRVVK